MTTVEPIVLDEFTLQLVVQLIDTGDIVNTGRGVADITDFITQTALPVIRGPKGAQGDPGLGIKPQGTVTTASARPTGLGNNSSDIGKAYFTADDYKLNVWTGSTWITSGSLRGQTGASGPLRGSDDYDNTTVPVGGATLAWSLSASKWGPWGPRGEIGYGLLTADTSLVAAQTTVLTVNVTIPAGTTRKVIATLSSRVTASDTGTSMAVWFGGGGRTAERAVLGVVEGSGNRPFTRRMRTTLAPGTYTFTAQTAAFTGGGGVGMLTGSELIVEDIGQA